MKKLKFLGSLLCLSMLSTIAFAEEINDPQLDGIKPAPVIEPHSQPMQPSVVRSEPRHDDVSGGKGYLVFGKSFVNFDKMNVETNVRNYGVFSSSFMIGGEGLAYLNERFVIGGGGYGIVTKKDTLLANNLAYSNYETQLVGGLGMFKIGYVPVLNDRFALTALAGVGAGAVSFDINEIVQPIAGYATTFASIMDTPKRGVVLTRALFLADLSLQADMIVGSDTHSGFLLGLKAGYIFDLAKGDWMMNKTTLINGPDQGLGGAYFAVIIGGGSNPR